MTATAPAGGPHASGGLRTLVVAEEYPWPVDSGSRIRLLHTLSGLARLGPVELFSLLPDVRTDIDPADPAAGLVRVAHVGYDARPPSGATAARTLVGSGRPIGAPEGDGGALRRQRARFESGRYDLVWYFGLRAWLLAGGWDAAPAVLDFDDLEDEKITTRLAVPPGAAGDRGVGGAAGVARTLRRSAALAFSSEERRRWRRLQTSAAAAVTTAVVCSELDATRALASGMVRPTVVPNGYRWVGDPVGRVAVRSPPTVVFPGTLRYPPNAQAARFLVGEIGPALRALVPDTRIRLVGVTTPALEALADPPRVTFAGRVPDIDVELAGADVVAVPIRFGSGTRIKILEAFAQRIPVVSATVGAEGLGVSDGTELLVADDAPSFARAISRLLVDEGLRAGLVERAHETFADRFRAERVEQAVGDVARAAAARGLPLGPGAGAG